VIALRGVCALSTADLSLLPRVELGTAWRKHCSLFSSISGQWRSQKFSTGGASICTIPFCPFPFSCPTKSAVLSKNATTYHTAGFYEYACNTAKSHAKKYVFPDRWCARPLRHLYGYATVCGVVPLKTELCFILQRLTNS